MTSAEVAPTLGADEARRRTDEAKRDAEALWREMAALFYDGVHTALEYTTWSDYCESEFGMAKSSAKQLLDSGRVLLAVEGSAAMAAELSIPSERVARVLAPLLPSATASGPGSGQRTGSDDQVAQAWAMVVEAHEDNGPITSTSARKVLVKAGVLADTGSGASGPPSWGESIGQVGDDLIKAGKDMDKFEALIGTKKPNQHVRDKAGRYVAWADDLATRLRAVDAG